MYNASLVILKKSYKSVMILKLILWLKLHLKGQALHVAYRERLSKKIRFVYVL